MSPFEILGFALIPGDVIPSFLRLKHLLRTKSTAGLSGVAVAQWSVSWWTWVAYAILIESIPLLIVSLVTAVVETVYLIFLLRSGLLSVKLVVLFVVGGFLLIITGIVVNPEIIAGVVTVADIIVLFPQVRKAIKESDLTGISVSAWTVDLIQDIGWVVYGFGIGHPLLAGWSLISAPSSILILVLALRKRKTGSQKDSDKV